MKDAQLRKALLLTRIEAHRQILRLELRCARATLDPWRLVVPRLVGALVGLVDRMGEEPAGRSAGDAGSSASAAGGGHEAGSAAGGAGGGAVDGHE